MVLALDEQLQGDGADLLRAVSRSNAASALLSGLSITPPAGTAPVPRDAWGGVAAGAQLLGLDEHQTHFAVCIAANRASGMKAMFAR